MSGAEEYKAVCKQAFTDWLEDEGMRMNPEGFEHAFSNHHYLSPAQFNGMNLWLEDFRKLFTPAPLK